MKVGSKLINEYYIELPHTEHDLRKWITKERQNKRDKQ